MLVTDVPSAASKTRSNNGGWLGQPDECHDESEDGLLSRPGGEDLSAYANGGDYTYDDNTSAGTITVNGFGAYIGWNKAYNLGELPADGTGMPQSTITYEVFDYTSNDGVDRLTITVDYGAMPGESYWTMRMISD